MGFRGDVVPKDVNVSVSIKTTSQKSPPAVAYVIPTSLLPTKSGHINVRHGTQTARQDRFLYINSLDSNKAVIRVGKLLLPA